MPNTNTVAIGSLLEVVGQFSLELAFCQPGKDSGLLPVNNFLMQVEESVQKSESPLEISQSVKLARQCVDRIFDTTAAFDTASIAWLSGWQTWVQHALGRWRDDCECGRRTLHHSDAFGAVMGDGRMGLILNVDTLVKLNGPTTINN